MTIYSYLNSKFERRNQVGIVSKSPLFKLLGQLTYYESAKLLRIIQIHNMALAKARKATISLSAATTPLIPPHTPPHNPINQSAQVEHTQHPPPSHPTPVSHA